ncbi:MAG: hypothetical protein R3F14_10360 [Polyangiaceae bacterium]
MRTRAQSRASSTPPRSTRNVISPVTSRAIARAADSAADIRPNLTRNAPSSRKSRCDQARIRRGAPAAFRHLVERALRHPQRERHVHRRHQRHERRSNHTPPRRRGAAG